MRLQRTTALLSCLMIADAFRDSAPFIMRSTESLHDLLPPSEVQTAEIVDNAAIQWFQQQVTALRSTEKRVVLAYQPGLKISDFLYLPKFDAALTSSKLSSTLSIANVVGEQDIQAMMRPLGFAGKEWTDFTEETFESSFDFEMRKPITYFHRQTLSEDYTQREKDLKTLDDQLSRMVNSLSRDEPATFVLVSSPRRIPRAPYHFTVDELYGMMHQDLKRNAEMHVRASNGSNKTSDNFQDGLPLFERYAYFSPALFMGMSVSILLLIILYVGVSAIAGLEVSYMAFSKEMAPQGQKKQE